MRDYSKDAWCFGLDIGTRTVIGVVGYKQGDEFVLVDYECREHEERAMLDGQIHDIHKVAQCVETVKATLEKRLDVQFKEVAIAAAGRALSTQIVQVCHAFEEEQEINLSHIHHLELEGVALAKTQQEQSSQLAAYYCVAYSVITYQVDGYEMVNLEGHKGQKIGVKLIATFLPKQVIDSLYAVTERAGLTVSHLTLEPIAAINAVIPEQIRLLNLALVDIGAGTADIAMTKQGSVVAYGMIPNAGDEVTEAIVHKYLVDFHTAERMKKEAAEKTTISYTDIIGLTHEIQAKKLKQTMLPVIEAMTLQVAEKIVALNGGVSPNAVFCVGGGSQMLEVTSKLAHHLKLVEERVALRSTMHLVKFRDEAEMADSPQMITPIGICMTMIQNKFSQFTFVEVNGEKVQLLNAKKLTILDAIIAAGIENDQIFPKRGATLMFKLNGERQRIKGENGVPSLILLNGREASIQESIKDGDTIQVHYAQNGSAPTVSVGSLIPPQKTIKLQGKTYTLPLVRVNGRLTGASYLVLPNDEIEVTDAKTLGALLAALDIDVKEKLITNHFQEVSLSAPIEEGDSFLMDDFPSCQQEVLTEEELPTDRLLENLYITVNEKKIALPKKESDYIFASIFDFIEFDLSKPQGTIQLVRNGEEGALTDVLTNGDRLEIYWKR